MGASFGSDQQKGSLNVELNIVPFIDLLSCLTAFLLVTAVWSENSRVDAATTSSGCKGDHCDDEFEQGAVLVTKEAIWIGVSRVNDFRTIPRRGTEHDWQAVGEELSRIKAQYLAERTHIKVAAEDDIPYQALISTMDMAVAAGFTHVGVTGPKELPAQPQL